MSTTAAPTTRPRLLATDRRWLIGLAALLIAVTAGVMSTAIAGSAIQTGVRAFVGGEGLWSKAEKNAVIHLERFVATHEAADWQGYRAAIEVIHGDRRARLELEKPDPDDAVVASGFVAGGNAPEDVPSMAMLFRTFRHLSYIDQAITIWTDADVEVDRLDVIAEAIRSAVERDDPIALVGLTGELDSANSRLTALEDRFSRTLGEGARWVQTVLLLLMGAILGVLLVVSATLGRFMLGRLRAADRLAADTLRASETRLRLLLDHLPAVAWTTDVDLRVTSMTGDALARLGIDGSTLVGRRFGWLLGQDESTIGEDRETARHAHLDALHGAAASYRTIVTERTFQVHVEPLMVDRRIIGTIGLGLDLTDRLELEARLERTTRLESIGRLAGGIAHDFNNLLTAITGYADLLTVSLPEGDLRDDAEQIRRAGQRAADLTGQLLAFGRQQVLKPELVQPNDVIAEMRHMLTRLVGEEIDLIVELDPELPLIMADPGQLEQVIVNLAINARDAMPGGGSLTIATGRTTMNAATTGRDGQQLGRSIDAVSIRVQDTGTGMDEATRARIFEPFFTTKGRGKGTGLGLSTVYGIVDQSGGSIQVDSTPAVGTTFTIRLATAVEPVAAATMAAAPRVPAGGAGVAVTAERRPIPIGLRRASSVARVGEAAVGDVGSAASSDPLGQRPTILVAEDEPAVRDLVVHLLESAGCTVIAAVDGREALRLAGGAVRIDALVSDVMMPHVNGPQLAAELRNRRPNLPVLFMSGYTGDVLGERGVMDPGVELLAKPFLPGELLERVRAILRPGWIGSGAGARVASDATPEPVVA
jgi:signal transduction histidine kinase